MDISWNGEPKNHTIHLESLGIQMAHQETLVDVARCVLDKSEMSWKTGWKLESMGDLQDPIDGGT